METTQNETIKQAVVAECDRQDRQAYYNAITPVHWTERVLLAVGDIDTVIANRKTDTMIQALLATRHEYNDDMLDMLADLDAPKDTSKDALDLILASL